MYFQFQLLIEHWLNEDNIDELLGRFLSQLNLLLGEFEDQYLCRRRRDSVKLSTSFLFSLLSPSSTEGSLIS